MSIINVTDTSSATYDLRLSTAIRNLRRANICYTVPLDGKDSRMTGKRRIREINRVIGERLMCIRTDLGMTQKEVSLMSGLSIGAISQVENGKTGGLYSVTLYADALRVPLEVLLRDTTKVPVGEMTGYALSWEPQKTATEQFIGQAGMSSSLQTAH